MSRRHRRVRGSTAGCFQTAIEPRRTHQQRRNNSCPTHAWDATYQPHSRGQLAQEGRQKYAQKGSKSKSTGYPQPRGLSGSIFVTRHPQEWGRAGPDQPPTSSPRRREAEAQGRAHAQDEHVGHEATSGGDYGLHLPHTGGLGC